MVGPLPFLSPADASERKKESGPMRDGSSGGGEELALEAALP